MIVPRKTDVLELLRAASRKDQRRVPLTVGNVSEGVSAEYVSEHAQGRGSETLILALEIGAAPARSTVRLTYATTGTLKKLGATAANTNQIVVLHQTSGKTLTVKDGENLKLAGEASLGENDTLTLICDGTNWIELSRSNN